MPGRKISLLSALLLILAGHMVQAQLRHRTETLLLMGSRFEITPYSPSDSLNEAAIAAAIAEIRRIETLISEWIPESKISEVNRNSGIRPVQVSGELLGLIKRCIKVSELTDGAFDITWASARGIWRFDGSMTSLPDPAVIDSVLPYINYRNILINESDSSIFLVKKGMAIGLGAIGKGYAANCARNVMQKMGVSNGIVIAGGDLITWGHPEEGKLWPIGISNPSDPGQAVAWLEVGEAAVVTSGNYERFVVIGGKRYCHIINPASGYPVSGLQSVTIICPDAELADALSTSVFVMGRERGLALINQLKGVECVILDDAGQFFTSSHIQLNKGKASTIHTINGEK
ncbi:MAG TPA: FAD:protein FMN transferase [Bacteroidales bacterium]|nr:FAD:protein FMN transferase [Bacteroidales bacterium]HRZ48527.1 FAD:protein FMN transferase [Bacteroidales bacterium]